MTSVVSSVSTAPDAEQLRGLAVAAARAGGAVAMQKFGEQLDVRLKPDRSEVTDADEAAQRAVIAVIHAQRLHDRILAEETLHDSAASGLSRLDARVCWIIDPIDGTRNFIRGIPYFGCAVAALLDGVPIAAAVFDASRNVTYSASLDAGFFIEDRHIYDLPPPGRASRAEKLLVGTPSSAEGIPRDILDHLWNRFVLRNFGATALHLAWVAAGHLHGVLVIDSKLWDVAAGWLMVQVTGGVMKSLDGSDIFPFDLVAYRGQPVPSIAACSPEVYAELSIDVKR